jgi:hypothetical protein
VAKLTNEQQNKALHPTPCAAFVHYYATPGASSIILLSRATLLRQMETIITQNIATWVETEEDINLPEAPFEEPLA